MRRMPSKYYIVVVRVLNIINRAYLHMTRLLSLQHTILISQTTDSHGHTSRTDIATTTRQYPRWLPRYCLPFLATGVKPRKLNLEVSNKDFEIGETWKIKESNLVWLLKYFSSSKLGTNKDEKSNFEINMKLISNLMKFKCNRNLVLHTFWKLEK